jgi:hypothetical protein
MGTQDKKKEDNKTKTEFSTSDNIKCHGAILGSDDPERVSDLIMLCRNFQLPEETQKQLLFMYDLTSGRKERAQDMPWPEQGETTNCEYIKEKYNLDSICRACTRYTSSNKTDTQKEKELLLYLLNSKYDKTFFPVKEEQKKFIEECFTSSENIQNGSSRAYVTIYRTFYKALAYLCAGTLFSPKEKVRSQIESDQLYHAWKTLNPTCCTNGDNRAIKHKIEYLYTASFSDSSDKKQYRDEIKKQLEVYKKSSRPKAQPKTETSEKKKKAAPEKKKEEQQPPLNEEVMNFGKEIPIIPTIEDNRLIENGYDTIIDGERLDWLCFEAEQNRQGICLDAIHIRDYEGIYLMLKIGDKKNILTEAQIENLAEYISYKLGKITTSSVIALCSVLIKNKCKIKAEIIQPSDKEYRKTVVLAEQKAATSAQDIDTREKNILMLYARSFRPGTGEEDCMAIINDKPEITRARVLLPEELPFTVKIGNILKDGQWNVLKEEIYATLEKNEIFRIHESGLWKEDNANHKFTYYVSRNKIRGMETVVRTTILRILEKMTEHPEFGVYPGKDI